MEEAIVTLLKEIEPAYYKAFVYIDNGGKMNVYRSQ